MNLRRRTYGNKTDFTTGKIVYIDLGINYLYSKDCFNTYSTISNNFDYSACSQDGRILLDKNNYTISRDFGNTNNTLSPNFVKTTSESIVYSYSFSPDYKMLVCAYVTYTYLSNYRYKGAFRIVFSYDEGVSWQDDSLIYSFTNDYDARYMSINCMSFDGSIIYIYWGNWFYNINTSIASNGKTINIKSYSSSIVCNYSGNIFGCVSNYTANWSYTFYSNSVILLTDKGTTYFSNNFYLSDKGNILIKETINNTGDEPVYNYDIYKIENNTTTQLAYTYNNYLQYSNFKLSFNGSKIIFFSRKILWDSDNTNSYYGYQLNVLSTDNPSFSNVKIQSETYNTGYVNASADISSDGKYIYFIGYRKYDGLMDVYRSDNYGDSFTKIFSQLPCGTTYLKVFTNKDTKIYE